MSRPNRGLCGLILLAFVLAAGCSSRGQQDFDAGLRLFRENKVKEALPLFQQAVARDRGNAEAFAWLAETHRRLGNKEEALDAARRSLDLQPRNSLAHLVIAEALFPYGGNVAQYDTVWYHVEQAVACDSTDGNVWQMMWAREIFAGDFGGFERVLRKMVETGFLTKAALSYGRWELQCLPRGAVLITNGDMDTFPAQAVQVTEELRSDVAVVERGLLNTPTGRRFVRDRLDVPMPYDEAALDSLAGLTDESGASQTAADHILKGWTDQQASGVFTRPITVAPTVDPSYYKHYQNQLVYAGAFLRWRPAPPAPVDTTTIRVSLGGIKPGDFSGPWVAENDRSPVRRVYTKYLAQNITGAAISYAQELVKSNRTREGADILTWADGFERETELGPAFTKEIEELRAELGLSDTTEK